MKLNTKSELLKAYQSVRSLTETLCQPLEVEDMVIQSMPEVSPAKWHLAHTTWFFETFLLKTERAEYTAPNEHFNYLFNSYYNTIGSQYPRSKRGNISRPTVKEVFEYRRYVDQELLQFIETLHEGQLKRVMPMFILGLNHEQQHQELMLTDIKHVLYQNPLAPAYKKRVAPAQRSHPTKMHWVAFEANQVRIGADSSQFAFDNETPCHEVLIQPFEFADRLVTNGEYLAFMEDRAYQRSQLWLSDGWDWIKENGVDKPLYWVHEDGKWYEFTLSGLLPLDLSAPVCHISYYEADAYAQWADARIPTEFEWEYAVKDLKIQGNFMDDNIFHPVALDTNPTERIKQAYGDVWEWTRSPYTAYPGFKIAKSAVGEYNGKFMSNQMVLRGGSCVSSQNHLRSSYRNFFHPHARWQFMGFRLARDLKS